MKEIVLDIINYIYVRPISVLIFGTITLCVTWTLINVLIRDRLKKIINTGMLVLIILIIIFYTVSGRSIGSERAIELVPFWSFTRGSFRSAFLNILFFLPLGLSMPYVVSDRIDKKALLTIIIAAFISITIEMIQYIFKLGLCETDDVIMNTLGAAIGTLSYTITTKYNKILK